VIFLALADLLYVAQRSLGPTAAHPICPIYQISLTDLGGGSGLGGRDRG